MVRTSSLGALVQSPGGLLSSWGEDGSRLRPREPACGPRLEFLPHALTCRGSGMLHWQLSSLLTGPHVRTCFLSFSASESGSTVVRGRNTVSAALVFLEVVMLGAGL